MIRHKFLTVIIFTISGMLLCTSNVMTQNPAQGTVRDFGAKGDSITNDTEAIQKAVDSGIGQIVFPKGAYRINKTILIDLDKAGPVSLNGFGSATIIMAGAGPAFKFVGTHEGSAGPSTFKNNVWRNQRMPFVDGLEIIGRHPEAIGIEANGTMQLTISRVFIREALHGIRLFSRNRNIIISECHIYNNRGIGIFLDVINLHQINISNSHISYNGGGGIVVKDGDVHNLQIGTCDIEANMSRNGPPTANILIDVSNGALMEGAIVGCTIQHDNTVPGSSNIRFIGHGPDKRTEVGMISIADNNLSETFDNVHIKYGRDVIITGNTFYMGTKNNILIEQSEHILISNNLSDKNPHYGSKTMSTNDNISIIESRNITINGLHLNNIIGEPAGILIDRCQNYNLANSTIVNCNFAGILVKDSENGKISGNFITDDRKTNGKPVSIIVQGGKNNLITDNFTNGIINAKQGTAVLSNNHQY